METSPDDIFRILQSKMVKESSDDIFHLLTSADWSVCKASKADYLPPTYEQDGFIHATKEANLLLTIANLYYTAAEGDFVVIRIRPSLLKSPIKYEAPAAVGDQETQQDAAMKFPHIYGPMNIDSVVQEYAVERQSDGTFKKIIGL
jgi:uncharacterized protein (DUF952 family)